MDSNATLENKVIKKPNQRTIQESFIYCSVATSSSVTPWKEIFCHPERTRLANKTTHQYADIPNTKRKRSEKYAPARPPIFFIAPPELLDHAGSLW